MSIWHKVYHCLSDKTICNAAYKSDDNVNNRNVPFRKEMQHWNFMDSVDKMMDDPNNAYLNKIAKKVNDEYWDTDYYEY